MLYILTFGGDAVTLETLPADRAAQARAELDAWWRRNRSASSASRILLGTRLKAPLTATTIRFAEGRLVLHDGPFTPEPEAIGGYGLIEVADLDAAVALARSWPAGGYVEIRPVLSPLLALGSPTKVIGYLRQITKGGRDR